MPVSPSDPPAPRHRPGVDIDRVPQHYRYLYETDGRARDEEPVATADDGAAAAEREESLKLVIWSLIAIALFGGVAVMLLLAPDTYGCSRGRCMHTRAAAFLSLIPVGVAIWALWERFTRKGKH